MKIEEFVGIFASALDDLDADEVTAATAFKQLAVWDSLAVLTVTDTVEMECGVLLSGTDFAAATTLEDLYETVRAKQAR
ncbi:acyl carrier protein [Coraliomargarita sp. SDUM461004]|uniref:Acyl carrier protein n=1 Tax=Thalassobacterium sedimentorum TaxID=3041258 RepID=A0ABU1AFL0_9BACT|nr:acyl carrier protein [Coraliomargarita sp. SDUM461004]MDQ8193576.1 acyl carrier protein [Coraliomargarita sp. SDUM461004]